MATNDSTKLSKIFEAPYPHEFISMLADQANQQVLDWLKANNAPESIWTLASLSHAMGRTSEILKHNGDQITRFWELDLQNSVSEITWAIVKAGGVFENGYVSSVPRGTVKGRPVEP